MPLPNTLIQPYFKNLIQYFEDNGNYDVALAELDKMAAKDTMAMPPFGIKSTIVFIKKDDTAKAIPAYEKAIEIYPDPQYVMSLGGCMQNKKSKGTGII